MTNEEAIKMLKSKMDGYTDTSYEWVETVRMAIKALEKQDRIAQILDDYDLLDTWEVLEMIKEVMKEDKKYRCEHCKFAVYMVVEEKYWCPKHCMYACEVERNVGFTCKLFQEKRKN